MLLRSFTEHVIGQKDWLFVIHQNVCSKKENEKKNV